MAPGPCGGVCGELSRGACVEPFRWFFVELCGVFVVLCGAFVELCGVCGELCGDVCGELCGGVYAELFLGVCGEQSRCFAFFCQC